MKFYVKEINTVIFNKTWTPLFKALSDEDAGKLIKALFGFMNGEKVEVDEKIKPSFLCIADQIELSARKYYSKVFREER